MFSRRRLLLSYLANSFKYLPYSYEYLYYGLVPTTIDSKQVRNKAKVSKLYGNSVVENQLVQNGDFSDGTNGWGGNSGAQNFSTISVSNGILTQTYTGTPDANYKSGIIVSGSDYRFDTYSGHYYLVHCKFKSSIACSVQMYSESTGYFTSMNVPANTWVECSMIKQATRNKTNDYIFINLTNATILSSGDTLQFAEIELIDLTQRHPFNTPTTLTDNRVQAILNRGYIPFNLGELKSVNIGEISTTKADTTALDTITFKYQGSGVGTSHDTYELTKTAHVFTKNMNRVDLGTPNWYYDNTTSHETMFSDVINNIKAPANTDIVNGICAKYQPISWDNLYSHSKSGIAVQPNGRLRVYTNDMGTNPTDFKTAMSGVMLEYQLATPQVITIPRKHLGIVDLGSLTYGEQGGGFTSQINAKYIGATNLKPNIYCYNYETKTLVELTNGTLGISILGDGKVWIKDSNLTLSNINTKLSGILLFYETESEVADITDTFDIESGGTINTNWFTWVENQLLANGNFEDTSGWRIINGTASVSNNILTQTITSIGSHKWGNGVYVESFNPPLNHKYLCIAYVKPKYNGNCLIGTGYTSNLSNNISIVANAWNLVCAIVENTTNSGAESRFSIAVDCTTNYQVGDTIDYRDAQCIDLTVGFGAGNEPTDINDYRIQYILKYGYIPTNLTGTEKHIQNEVLANADFLMKCK